MQVIIRCWNSNEYSGELKNAELSINSHKIDINDVKGIRFNKDHSSQTITGRISLSDSGLDFKLKTKGFFNIKYDGNLKGFFEVYVKSLNFTHRIAIHEISAICFINEHS